MRSSDQPSPDPAPATDTNQQPSLEQHIEHVALILQHLREVRKLTLQRRSQDFDTYCYNAIRQVDKVYSMLTTEREDRRLGGSVAGGKHGKPRKGGRPQS